MNFTLQPGSSARGRVVDEQGDAVARAEVSLNLEGPGEDGEGEFVSSRSTTTLSDNRGVFVIGLWPDPEFDRGRIVAQRIDVGRAEVEVHGDRKFDLDLGEIVLRRGRPISGTVVCPHDDPLPEIMVVAVAVDWSPGSTYVSRTGLDGTFCFAGLDDGLYDLTVDDGGDRKKSGTWPSDARERPHE